MVANISFTGIINKTHPKSGRCDSVTPQVGQRMKKSTTTSRGARCAAAAYLRRNPTHRHAVCQIRKIVALSNVSIYFDSRVYSAAKSSRPPRINSGSEIHGTIPINFSASGYLICSSGISRSISAATMQANSEASAAISDSSITAVRGRSFCWNLS